MLFIYCLQEKAKSEFSNFAPRASSTLRNFPKFLALDFSQLSDALRKRLNFHINVQQGLKNY